MVSIIILSYNTKELLKSCIDSIHTYVQHGTYEIIVVDNNSHDGSPEFIKKKFPELVIIQNKENQGFAKGVNIGAQHANGEYLLFLNSDAVLNTNVVKVLRKTLDNDKNIGVVGGMMKNSDGSVQRSHSSFYDLWPVTLLLFGGDTVELLGNHSIKEKKVDWVSGGLMMISRKLFREIGGFDENFFMYIEDMELCKRVHDNGYSVVVNSEAVVMHKGYGSSNREFAIVNIYKGLIYYYRKHKNGVARLVLKFLLVLKALIAILIGTVSGKKSLRNTYIHALQVI